MVPHLIEAFVLNRNLWMEDTMQRAEGCFIFSRARAQA